jgi:flavorubredoxin
LKPVKIRENIYWVGAVDWKVRDFHGYLIPRGTTYNAYLIIDEKITLIDTVKADFFEEMMTRVSAVIDPAKIDYIVVNHVEMDHSGALPRLLEVAKKAKVITSPNGERGLKAHYKKTCFDFGVIKSGDRLQLGTKNLTFVHTPMVHWPDNMVTYLAEEKVLFSNDAFGQHLATAERFNDELPLNFVLEEASKYYANIVLPYGSQVQKALEALKGLEMEVIAPSHGLIWRTHLREIIKEYQKWAVNETENKAVIVYDTMWDSTERIAYAVQEAFEEQGIRTSMVSLKANHISEIMNLVLTAKYICVGSPTLNNNMLPSVASFLTYLKGLAPKKRMGMAFGSYGWGGQSIGQVEEVLTELGFELFTKASLQYVPDEEQLQKVTEVLKAELQEQTK